MALNIIENVLNDVSLCNGDLPKAAMDAVHQTGVVSWDIETSGLKWKSDKIATCQVYVPGLQVFIVRITDAPRPRLMALLGDSDVCKIFHHAMFDLRFMSYHWSVEPQNVACTKIASKVLFPMNKNHSLKEIVFRHLGVILIRILKPLTGSQKI